MLCYICQSVEIRDIQIDIRDKKIRHCSQCEEVIQQNLEDISKKGRRKKPMSTKPKPEDAIAIEDDPFLLDEDFDSDDDYTGLIEDKDFRSELYDQE